jgi:hypothetical protein
VFSVWREPLPAEVPPELIQAILSAHNHAE